MVTIGNVEIPDQLIYVVIGAIFLLGTLRQVRIWNTSRLKIQPKVTMQTPGGVKLPDTLYDSLMLGKMALEREINSYSKEIGLEPDSVEFQSDPVGNRYLTKYKELMMTLADYHSGNVNLKAIGLRINVNLPTQWVEFLYGSTKQYLPGLIESGIKTGTKALKALETQIRA